MTASSDTVPATPSPSTAKASLPLFYVRPEPLSAQRHGRMALLTLPDFRFAATTNAVPIMAGEFAEAMRFYPIVFAGQPAHPVTVMGLKRDNLFVDRDGQWSLDHYIPAYVRRYPFVFIDAGAQGFALGVDADCERLKDINSVDAADQARYLPLFEDSKPSAVTQGALQFSAALQAEHRATTAFAEALLAHDLLVEQQAQGEINGGERFSVQGFRIVDAQKFAALPDDVVVQWHKTGWLGLVHLHLASLARWRDLLDRQGLNGQTGQAEPAPARKPAAAATGKAKASAAS